LSLHREDKNLFPTKKLNAGLGFIKERSAAAREEESYILEFLSSFHCYV